MNAMILAVDVDASDTGVLELQGRSPEHMFQIRSYLDVIRDLEFTAALYYVSRIERQQGIPAYFRLDLGLTWRPVEHVELSIWGQNLTEAEHAESNAVATNETVTEIQRGMYGRVTLRF